MPKYYTADEVGTLAQYLLDHPRVPLNQACREFKVANATTLRRWFILRPNPHLVKWFAVDDRLVRWQRSRPRQIIGAAMLDQIALCQTAGNARAIPAACVMSHPITVECEKPQLPTLVPFVPQTADDLLVIREQILDEVTDAQIVLQRAEELVAAIDMVRDAINSKERVRVLEATVARLTNQLDLADANVAQLKGANLRINQIHSRD